MAVVHHAATGTASLAGLQTCGSVWMCPICASKVSERRRLELGEAVRAWEEQGGRVLLVTFTIRHKRGDDLASNVDAMLNARRLSRSGRWAQGFAERVGLAGSVRALEVTHGANGWHPHLHELLFVAGDVDPELVLAELRERWAAMVGKAGLRDVNSHGVDVQLAQWSVAEYIAKFGRERSWGPEHEVSKAVVKQGRAGSRTPSGLLADYGAGDAAAGVLWQEYAKVFKGRRQLVWSRGLRELLDLEPELTDEELAEQETACGVILITLTVNQWRVVLGNDARAELLHVAKEGNVEKVRAFLWLIGVT